MFLGIILGLKLGLVDAASSGDVNLWGWAAEAS